MEVLQEAGKILVLNAGSSSLKFKLFSLAPALVAGVGGVIDRIGDTINSNLVAKGDGQKWTNKVPIKDHVSAMECIMAFLSDKESKSIHNEVQAVGHRIVHGLDIHQAALLDAAAISKLQQAATLAPLHNPPGLQGLSAAMKVFKGVPQVGVFDTAFHQTMPAKAYMYGIPYDYFTQHKIRRYGFHGTSHKYLAETAASMLGKSPQQINAITCHLGNGSSIAAVKNGVSVDTSMGLTPLEGLVMGTRSGDMDPAVPLHLMSTLGLSAKEMDAILNKKSGLLGVCGHSDLRAVLESKAAGDERAALALDMFVYRVRKYIGAYSAALSGRVDSLVFSAGIGENSSVARALICEDMQAMGIAIDDGKNKAAVGGVQADISAPDSRMRVLVVPTDEELSIAQQTLDLVSKIKQQKVAVAA
ncbi:acetate kinase [Scenedesmus sp. NREL 46B-D3]|nr:acetate kinase [Scenedesmus sp. NREL 46B-D3]